MVLSSLSVSISALASELLLTCGRCRVQDRLAVHLGFMLLCLAKGNIERAHQASISYGFFYLLN